MNKQTPQMHSFSLTVAKEYGDTAAIVFGYLSAKIHRSKHLYDGKQWYFESIEEIAKKYPYFSKTSVYEAIRKLTTKDGLLITGNFNNKGYDRTTWYAFKTKEAGALARRRLAYFGIQDAELYGIAKAVLISLASFMISQERKTNPNYNAHQMSATELARILPYGKSTIQRKLKELVDDCVFYPRPKEDRRDAAHYGFEDAEEQFDTSSEKTCVIPSKKDVLVAPPRISNIESSGLNSTASNPNESGPNPNDNTILENILEKTVRKSVGSSSLVVPPSDESQTFTSRQNAPDRVLAEFKAYLASPTSRPPSMSLASSH